jgi:uncharacterized membrane protein YbhN (UPF0104 family)
VAVLFVPGGIGVREGVTALLLSSAVSPEQALLAAGAARALSLIADILPLALISAWHLGAMAIGRQASSAVNEAAAARPADH